MLEQDVRLYLEAVFALCPQPEEYVKYRLHLATRLTVGTIHSWFENKRITQHNFTQECGFAQPRPPSAGDASTC